MKAKNMKVGTPVVIKGCSRLGIKQHRGVTGVITRRWSHGLFACADVVIADGNNVECYAYELRKVKEGEVV